MSRLVVVSNRVADLHSGDAASKGGLAMAMRRALEQKGGLWFGWSGETSTDPHSTPRCVTRDGITAATVDLTPQEASEYYDGFANRTLWPLFHYRTDLAAYERSFSSTYTSVNRSFAAALVKLLRPDDVIWVHDYHLIPLGQELRAAGVTNRIGFFLHIPWPAREVFTTLPHHLELVWAMFAYDLAGFQTAGSRRAFEDYAEVELGVNVREGGLIDHFGRRLIARDYPISIDPEEIADLLQSDSAGESYRQLKSAEGHSRLLLGVDRMDYTKGLPQKFRAFASFLENHPENRGSTCLLQIGQPTRGEVGEYQDLTHQLVAEVGRINGQYGTFGWNPLTFHIQSYGRDALAGIYRAADAALVTPLRDGMNLVAKEFVAAQDPDDPGVLILSRFAGAAEQMPAALLINPHSHESYSDAIARALAMPLDERTARWRELYSGIESEPLSHWRDRFLSDLTHSNIQQCPSQVREHALSNGVA